MTLQQCLYIIEISKYNSISKAANSLNMMQPSISKAIKDLEIELNIKIFDRTNKGVIFTKDGNELLFHAKKLIEQSEAIKYHFNKEREEIKKINISSQHYGFVIKSILNLMNKFESTKYELSINEGKTIDVIEDVYSNKSILGIISITNQNKEIFKRHLTSKSLVFISLNEVNQSVFVRKEHPLSSLESIKIDQLKDYPYLTYIKDDVLLSNSEEIIKANEINQVIYLNDRATMNSLLSNTNGFNIGTGLITKGFIEKNIISIPIESKEKIQIGFIKRFETVLNEDIKMFIEFLEKSLQN